MMLQRDFLLHFNIGQVERRNGQYVITIEDDRFISKLHALYEEHKLRSSDEALQDLWEQYQVLLNLTRNNNE